MRPFSYPDAARSRRDWVASGQVRFLWVRPRYERCTYKNTTCTIRNKKVGLYREGKKVGWGVVLVRRFGDDRLITHVSIAHISIHTAIGMDVYSDSCISVWATMWIAIYVDMYVYG